MHIRLIDILLAAAVMLLPVSSEATQAKPSLERYAGSYTGTAVSSTSAGPLSGSATLTFTGIRNSLRGTFLYTGILNQLGVPQYVGQTFNITRTGRVRGRVTVGNVNGSGSGSAKLAGKRLRVSITYLIKGTPSPTTILLTGTVKFSGKRATWTAAVTSNDPGYNGSLVVQGKR